VKKIEQSSGTLKLELPQFAVLKMVNQNRFLGQLPRLPLVSVSFKHNQLETAQAP
jgi:hypothetical protein